MENLEGYIKDEVGYSFKEYDISHTPNDFNTKTIVDFIESGVFQIPGFQRNYVWDIKRASKLIESILIGLPIPQVFLYEKGTNEFLVIDGQQRLLTLYFFKKGRFPIPEKRFEIREIFTKFNRVPDEIFSDDKYFKDFRLKFIKDPEHGKNPLEGKAYEDLGDKKTSYDLRTIRNVIIKQNSPSEDNSSMYEIFNRLNSGGVTLFPQEIRSCLFYSDFYELLYKLNHYESWRKLLQNAAPDIHLKDVEIILRSFSLLESHNLYSPSMTRFLNKYSKRSMKFSPEKLDYLAQLFKTFCSKMIELGDKVFISQNSKFSITIFESIFVAVCEEHFNTNSLEISIPTLDQVNALKENSDFKNATQKDTASKQNVELRFEIAKGILCN